METIRFFRIRPMLFAVLCFMFTSGIAQQFEVDGLYYYLNSDSTSASVIYERWFYKQIDRYGHGYPQSSYTSLGSSVVIPEKVSYNGKSYDVTRVFSYAFAYCKGLKSIKIPASVKLIGERAFWQSGLVTLEILSNPKGVTIGDEAFLDCISLTSVVFNNPLSATFGNWMFGDCAALTTVVLPDTLTRVSAGLFTNCTSLKSLDFPATVTTFCWRILDGCSDVRVAISSNSHYYQPFLDCGIRKLILRDGVDSIKGMEVAPAVINSYPSTPPKCDDTSFTDYSATVHVRPDALDNYRDDPYWKNFANIVGDLTERYCGDTNDDGIIDTADMNLLINSMLGHAPQPAASDWPCFDLNDDGALDVADLNALIDLLLGRTKPVLAADR